MLYDPRRDVTINNLIGWLEIKDSTEKYDYMDVCGNCLLGQFFNYIGLPWKDGCSGPGFDYWRRLVDADTYNDSQWTDPFLRISNEGEHTFGAALQRAYALNERV